MCNVASEAKWGHMLNKTSTSEFKQLCSSMLDCERGISIILSIDVHNQLAVPARWTQACCQPRKLPLTPSIWIFSELDIRELDYRWQVCIPIVGNAVSMFVSFSHSEYFWTAALYVAALLHYQRIQDTQPAGAGINFDSARRWYLDVVPMIIRLFQICILAPQPFVLKLLGDMKQRFRMHGVRPHDVLLKGGVTLVFVHFWRQSMAAPFSCTQQVFLVISNRVASTGHMTYIFDIHIMIHDGDIW